MTIGELSALDLTEFTVRQDGTVLDQANDEVDLDDLETCFTDWLGRIRKMSEAAKEEEVAA